MAKISIGDHVHYAPEGLEAPDASQTPTWIVTETNPKYSTLIQVGEPGLFSASVAPTGDLVAADPTDLTELPENKDE